MFPLRPGRHRELGIALEEIRFDNEIRVVVITGQDDVFCMTAPNHPHFHGHSPDKTWDGLQALQHTFQQIIEIEKPVIAKVNGGVKGWGSSLVFSCDFILAREDAVFCDHHLGMGDGNPPVGRPGAGIVPGDGGSIFVPLHMSPPLAREYLWLGKQLTGKELYRERLYQRRGPGERAGRGLRSDGRRSATQTALRVGVCQAGYLTAFMRSGSI